MGKTTDEWRLTIAGPEVYAAVNDTYDATRASTFWTLVERIEDAYRKRGHGMALRATSLDTFVALVAAAADGLAESDPAAHKVRGFANQLRALHKQGVARKARLLS